MSETYQWALAADVSKLAELAYEMRDCPLLAIGSGGSLSAAAFCSYLHQHATGALAKAVTPLESVLSAVHGPSHGAILLSAGGGNPDVLGAVALLVKQELHRFAAVCMRTQSALAKLATEHPGVSVIDYDLPTGKDGFLATNSLLAMTVLLVRAYYASSDARLPSSLPKLLGAKDMASFGAKLGKGAAAFLKRPSIVVLHSPCTHAAAADLESKFTEAALGNVQVADYRNFAHGRHHWIAKQREQTSVLAFVTSDVANVADFTLAALPKSVPIQRFDLGQEGPRAGIAGIVHTLFLVGFSGRSQGVDPGRPAVPEFGRKIYHLKAFGRLALKNGVPPREEAALMRKTAKPLRVLDERGELAGWRAHYRHFVSRLASTPIRALVLDYDGTLCDSSQRFIGPDRGLTRRLAQFVKAGVTVGIVTGRGQSVREALRKSLPQHAWEKVLVGYYNGAVIQPLKDDAAPREAQCQGNVLGKLGDILKRDATLSQLCSIECRQFQLSLEAKHESSRPQIWDVLQHHIVSVPGVRTVESSHSIDVIAPGVSKVNLVARVREAAGTDQRDAVLCIGDCGRWPGNDFELLAEPSSLSVLWVSSAPDTCWNIALPENRLLEATREYLSELFAVSRGELHLNRSLLKE